MKIQKRKGFNIELMLVRLAEARTINQDGSISMPGFGMLDEFESYLRTAIVIKGKTDAFVRSVIKKAIHAEQNPTEARFLEHCRRIAHTKVKQDQKTYKVLFPIWGNIEPLSGRRKWDDVSITFDISVNSRFAKKAIAQRAQQLKNRGNNATDTVVGLQSLPLAMCSVKAIDVHDAYEQAEQALSKELGLYSLTTSRGKFILTDEYDKPINTILLAPQMTVHDENGAMSADIYWFNRWPNSFTPQNRNRVEVARITKRAEYVRTRLKQLPWREEAEIALERHYSAFAQCDLEASFLDAWRLLETIGGHSREKSETLVKRAAWFFDKRDEHYQTGLHLMHRRNLISHGKPVRDHNNEALAFQMKLFLTPFLNTFLTNPFKFESLEEFWHFCDSPVEKRIRTRKSYLLKCASKFRLEE